jgi:hypothetical protein
MSNSYHQILSGKQHHAILRMLTKITVMKACCTVVIHSGWTIRAAFHKYDLRVRLVGKDTYQGWIAFDCLSTLAEFLSNLWAHKAQKFHVLSFPFSVPGAPDHGKEHQRTARIPSISQVT